MSHASPTYMYNSFDTTRCEFATSLVSVQQASRVIWQKTALPFCHLSRRRMHSFAACSEQVHSPAADAMHSRVGTLQCAGTCLPPQKCLFPVPMGDLNPHAIHGSLDPHESAPRTKSRSVQPFLDSSLVWPTHTDTQATLHATPMHCVHN